jgi:hypothetical protein
VIGTAVIVLATLARPSFMFKRAFGCNDAASPGLSTATLLALDTGA